MPFRRRAGIQRDVLMVSAIEHDCIVLRDGRRRAVLESSPTNWLLLSESEREGVLAGALAFFNALEWPLQMLGRVVPADIEGYLTVVRRQRERHPELVLDHERFVRRAARELSLRERRFYVVVPSERFGEAAQRGSALQGLRSLMPWTRRRLHAARTSEERGRLDARCGQTVTRFEAQGVRLTRLGRGELAALLGETLRGTHREGAGAVLWPPSFAHTAGAPAGGAAW